MGFLIAVVVGFLLFAGVIGYFSFAEGERAREKAEANADAFLADTFDGRPDVIVTINMRTPSYETVVLGAKERGYRLVHESTVVESLDVKRLIFERG